MRSFLSEGTAIVKFKSCFLYIFGSAVYFQPYTEAHPDNAIKTIIVKQIFFIVLFPSFIKKQNHLDERWQEVETYFQEIV